MFCLCFILSLCVLTSCNEDDEWLKCKPKPGCSIAQCDPLPPNRWFGKDGKLEDEFPILCQKKNALPSSTVNKDVDSKIYQMQKENSELREELIKFQAKNKASERILKLALCPLTYKESCFLLVAGRKVTYDGGVALCESLGGHLANIYSQTHMDNVMKYIREHRMSGVISRWIRTGMRYDSMANKLMFRNGTDAPLGLKWYPKNPETGPKFVTSTNVILGVQHDENLKFQYLYNRTPTRDYRALCEIE